MVKGYMTLSVSRKSLYVVRQKQQPDHIQAAGGPTNSVSVKANSFFPIRLGSSKSKKYTNRGKVAKNLIKVFVALKPTSIKPYKK